MVEYTGTIRVVNMAPLNGTCHSPVWIGLHNGTFDMFDLGMQASASLEAMAEDGDLLPIVREFDRDESAVWNDIVGDGPICPGEATKIRFNITFNPGSTLYLSYAAKVLPSNDAFVANDDPMEHKLFREGGKPDFDEMFKIIARGREVLDAGTELNDELPENTAFLEQETPNTGFSVIPFGAVVAPHPGFKAPGEGGILDEPDFVNATFTEDGYKILRIVVILDEEDSPEEASPDDETSPDDATPIPVDGGLLRRRRFF